MFLIYFKNLTVVLKPEVDTCFVRAFALIENNVINGQVKSEIASERFNFSLSSMKERRVFFEKRE